MQRNNTTAVRAKSMFARRVPDFLVEKFIPNWHMNFDPLRLTTHRYKERIADRTVPRTILCVRFAAVTDAMCAGCVLEV